MKIVSMERTRYFRSSNGLNSAVNLLSGNLLPLGDGGTKLSFFSILWIICMWTVKLTYFLTGLFGSLYFAELTTEDVFKKSGAMGALCTEVIILTTYLNLQRKEFEKLVNQYNVLLIDSDDLKRCIHETLAPYKKYIKFYMIATFCANSTWSAAPILQVFNTTQFTYADLTVPAYMPGEPFGRFVFAAGAFFQIWGSNSVHFAKISVDLYVLHFIAVLAAQYKFVGEEICRALRDENGEKDELTVVDALQQCVRYHSAVISY